MMKRFLESLPPAAQPKRFLDISSSYGYFVHEMAKLGFDAHGVEIDPIARDVGVLAWSLPEENIHRAEAVRFLESAVAGGDRYEVVTCLSLLHHFVLGMGCIHPEQFIRLVDGVTGSVLFLDMGQGTERWFSDSLRRWTPDFIARWMKENTSFRRVVALGTDSDGVGPYAGNYGRTLFACTR